MDNGNSCLIKENDVNEIEKLHSTCMIIETNVKYNKNVQII